MPERCPICGKPVSKDGSWYYCTDEECEYVWDEDGEDLDRIDDWDGDED